ncbi:uncharacterized protein LOC120250338 [Dioscorea cayenensis subsp. rotundata]|uniref:Uncharacterized protein LOC120250338 n=1 Tax=Dioscorea cayennensis subsp. rotundata TaxID=55577 RepID=A0AB40AJR5_DIOCR|nr:uncharacterized protein LOC120250338 [Dioscorea cayenensis subsp. rotundata]XP_039115077.1 uncharacterized protein LOC120250338 [Dioscorea cayenensis subsp. rotundata]
MESFQGFIIFITFVVLLSAYQYKAQSPGSSTIPAKQLDSVLQGYGFSAFVRPHTGVIYDANVPVNLTGIKVSVLRLRSGSLLGRGVHSFKEFDIPVGVWVHPYVERLVFVYQNLGNWSSVYYPLPGFRYLAPVLSLLIYDAANLSATNLPEIDFVASKLPISINFTNVAPVPSGLTPKCVWFNLDGSPEFRELVTDNVCSTYRQGHFSIVVNSTGLAPSPAPSAGPNVGPIPVRHKSHNSTVWKIVGGVLGGFVILVLAAWLLGLLLRYTQKKKVAKMEQHAEVGETLRMARVGNAQAPVAYGTRTQPMLENEYVA